MASRASIASMLIPRRLREQAAVNVVAATAGLAGGPSGPTSAGTAAFTTHQAEDEK